MITDFKLCNAVGWIDGSNPFEMFGPVPVSGDFCELQNPKLFNQLTRPIRLHMDWACLPHGDLTPFKLLISSGEQIQEASLFSSVITIKFPAFKKSLRLVLSAPAEAFGHSTYETRMVEAMVKSMPVPEPPFVPVLNKLWIDYLP